MIRHVSAVVIVLVLNATPLFGQSAGAPTAELIVKAAAADVQSLQPLRALLSARHRGHRARNQAQPGIMGRSALAGYGGWHRLRSCQYGNHCSPLARRGVQWSGRANGPGTAVATAATAATSANTDARSGQPRDDASHIGSGRPTSRCLHIASESAP